MIIGAYLRHCAPDHPAGAEWTIYDTFTWLTKRGHDCRVLAEQGYSQTEDRSGLIYTQPTDEIVARHFRECDVMITQLDATMQAQLLAAAYQTPLVQYVHSENQLDNLGVIESCSALVVANSHHVAKACAWWPGEMITLHPAIDAERVRVPTTGVCATLVNLSAAKGGAEFWRLALDNETIPFLGVMGAYDQQAITTEGLALHSENESATGLPPNMRVLANLRDIRHAFTYTGVLLVLSHTETYGRVAAEAMASGIPVVAVATPGLHEACGDGARYVDDRGQRGLIAKLIRDAPSWREDAVARWGVIERRQQRELVAFEKALHVVHATQPEMTL